MSRISTLEPVEAPQPITALYEAVKKKLGLVPNMVKTLGHSASALQAYLNLSGAVAGGKLPAATREKIALLVAEQNQCDYCLSAHTAIGGIMKIPADEVEAARRGESADRKEQALLVLANHILATHGDVSERTYASVVAEGVTPEEAAEVVANVALNVFTNYFNRFAQTQIDFPVVKSHGRACACGR
jgi:uncharacterized peroxidase-related enzyme